MLHYKFTKPISLKQAFVIVILIHVAGYGAICSYSSHRAEKRKQALIAKKEEEAKLQRMLNKDTSSMFPPRGKPVVVAVSPFKPNKLEENYSEESPIKKAVNIIAQMAINTLTEKAINMIHSSASSVAQSKQQVTSAEDTNFNAGFCPNPTVVRSSFVPEGNRSTSTLKSTPVKMAQSNKATAHVNTTSPNNKSSTRVVYSSSTAVKYPQLNQEALKSEFLKIKKQLASISNVEKEVTQIVRSNIHPHATTAAVVKVTNGEQIVKSVQNEFDHRIQIVRDEFNSKPQSAHDYIHEDITNQIISSNIVY